MAKKAKKQKARRPKNGSVPGRIHTKTGIKASDILIQCRVPVKTARALSARAKIKKVSRAAIVRAMLIG